MATGLGVLSRIIDKSPFAVQGVGPDQLVMLCEYPVNSYMPTFPGFSPSAKASGPMEPMGIVTGFLSEDLKYFEFNRTWTTEQNMP